MENKKVLTQKEAKELTEDLVMAAKVVCALAEVDAPGNKQIVLDALIGELEEMAGRKKVCVGEGTCRNNELVKSCGEPQNLNFGNAIRLVKEGFRIARKGWNGKGQYVELASCVSYVGSDGQVVNADHQAIGNKALAFVGTSGVQLGWLASQADMLAEDWYVVK